MWNSIIKEFGEFKDFKEKNCLDIANLLKFSKIPKSSLFPKIFS